MRKLLMNKRSFFKSLALMTAGAAVSPGIFIPKFEPVKWKPLPRSQLTMRYLNKVAHELDVERANFTWIETTYRLKGDVWMPDDAINFEPVPATRKWKPGWISVLQS